MCLPLLGKKGISHLMLMHSSSSSSSEDSTTTCFLRAVGWLGRGFAAAGGSGGAPLLSIFRFPMPPAHTRGFCYNLLPCR